MTSAAEQSGQSGVTFAPVYIFVVMMEAAWFVIQS